MVTLGGDGTILRASSLFKTGPVPPVLSFSMGTLGFLLPYRMYSVFFLLFARILFVVFWCLDIHDFREAIQDVYEGRAKVLDRMRLSCTFHDTKGIEFGSCGSVGQ